MVGARSPWTSDGRKGPEHRSGLIPSCQHKELLPLTCQCSVSPGWISLICRRFAARWGEKVIFLVISWGGQEREALPCVKIGPAVQIDKHQICLLAQSLSPLLGPLFFISTSSWKI